MEKRIYFLTILLVFALGMGGCSDSAGKSTIIDQSTSTINEQSTSGTLKVEAEQTTKVTQSIQPTEMQESSEKEIKDSAAKDIAYKEYYNNRFGFSIEYPDSFVTKMLPDNGDGIILESLDGNAELTVSGSNNVSDSKAELCFNDFVKDLGDISFQKQKDNWFVVSWVEGDKILYKKKLLAMVQSIRSFSNIRQMKRNTMTKWSKSSWNLLKRPVFPKSTE